jgi:hypothetical protein
VNGDGYSDVIVGAAFYDNGQLDEGAAFVYHGSRNGLAISPSWRAEGQQPASRFGERVATAGDVNGDGFADVIISAYTFDNGETDEGRAFVYLGSVFGLAAAPAWITESDQSNANWGRSLSSAGDVNGDGYSDVIVGAPLYDNAQTDEGGAFVFHGSETGLSTTADWTIESNQTFANLGISVSTAGDVDRDGYSDVIVGSPAYNNGEDDEGRVFVHHGSASGLEENAGWMVESNQTGAAFGFSVATAGDVNGDGHSDVIVGALFYDNGENNEGGAFIYKGSPGGLSLTPGWIGEGDQASASYGNSVATAGDVNGDGYSDIVVGAPLYDNGENDEGRAYIYHGASAGIAFIRSFEIDQSAQYGRSVATAGDVNGDGFSDVIVGANFYGNGQAAEGGAFVYSGNGGSGLNRIPSQWRRDDSAPIGVLGRSDSPNEFILKALGRNAAGRDRVRLQAEVKPFGVPFDGTGLVSGPAFDTGTPGGAGSVVLLSILTSNLAPDQLYHWRVRILGQSPFAPRTPWLWLAMNGLREADLRTDFDPTAVKDGSPAPVQGRFLGPSAPNPFGVTTELPYTLPERGRVRLGVFDVHGRQVARIADEIQAPGRHRVHWNGRGDGHSLPAGVYFLRLEFGGTIETQKLVLVP